MSRPVLCYVNEDGDPDETYREAQELARAWSLPLVFVSGVPPAERESGDLVLDAYDLEAQFFPLLIRRPFTGLIISIREVFARQLIPSVREPEFFAPTRTQLRTDNVYYRTAKQFSKLRRGSPIFFYETQRSNGKSHMIGEAKLDEWRVGEPRDMFAAYGNLGVYTLTDLDATANAARGSNRGKVLGLKFDWYREFDQPLSLAKVKAIMPKYNSITARELDSDSAFELREAAGWNVTELSYQ